MFDNTISGMLLWYADSYSPDSCSPTFFGQLLTGQLLTRTFAHRGFFLVITILGKRSTSVHVVTSASTMYMYNVHRLCA